MSLIPFHRGLISAAIVFCFGYAAWEIVGYSRGGGVFPLIGLVFVVLGIGLVYYLARLNRFLGYESGEVDDS
jgi:hypothetical protein